MIKISAVKFQIKKKLMVKIKINIYKIFIFIFIAFTNYRTENQNN